jgi:hypothetical protein
MATIKKPSKAQVKLDTCKDLEKTILALNNGAKLVFDNVFGYGVEYPTGGYFKITKTIHDKITKNF